MAVQFPPKATYDFDETSVSFPVIVDGAQHRVLITAEALQDHFGLETLNSDDAVVAFNSARPAIEERVRQVLGQGARGDIRLGKHSF